MRKKDKLYTANKWNQPLFAQGIDRENQNIFDGMFSSSLDTSNSDQSFKDSGGIDLSGIDVTGVSVLGDPTKIDVNALKSIKLPKQRLKLGLALKGLAKSLVKSEAGVIGSAVGNLGYGLIGGGLSSGAGKAINSVGSTIGGAISTINPVAGGIVSAASGIIGGGVNALIGAKFNDKNISKINDNINSMRSSANTLAGATTSDDFLNKTSNLSTVGLAFNRGDIGKDGVFSNKVKKKYNSLKNQQDAAQAYASHALTTGANNVDSSLDDSVLTNFAAMGGPLDIMNNRNDMGAIDYGFMSDYLTMRNKATEAKNKVPMNVFGSLPVTPLSTFALGGDMQTNGADFNTGLMHIDAGNSHEENPYDGVQLGVDPEGKPNLVEEGETIFDDYVFSKRIKADAETKKKFHVGKKANISYADLSKRIERESLERPNDPISQAGLRKQLQDLAGEQERQKTEQQQKEVETAFAMLPPEQQRAIMEQVAMEEQQAMQQQENPQQMEQMQMEQPTEEQIMQQQQMEQPQMEENNMAQMNAYGGKINKFDKGGDMKRAIYKALNLYTDSDFENWRLNQKLDEIKDWENITKNKSFMSALAGVNPVLSDAIERGYDFGEYKAPTGKYDLEAFNKSLDNYKKSKTKGNTSGNYAVDKEFGLGKYKTIQELENSPEYKAYTQYMTDALNRSKGIAFKYKDSNESYDNIEWKDPNKIITRDDWEALRTLQHHIDGTSINPNGDVVPLWNKADEDGYSSLVNNAGDLFTAYRTDGKGGIFHMTPTALARNNQAKNLVVNDDGTVEEIYGNVPKDWANAGNYSWADDNSDYTYNYYRRPAAADKAATDAKNDKKDKKIVPIHKTTLGRYAGLFGPAVGLGMQALGIGKPDYSGMDAAVETASGAPTLASYKPIGNYIDYNPMDIWYEQNRMNANARAADRAILNNASPIGTKMVGIIANNYNNQIASGDLYRKALEYNDAKRQKVAEFNRGTDMYNANAFNQTSATNAQILNNSRNFKAQMQMDAAKQRMASDASWNQGIYGNVSNLFKGLGDWGKENAQHNMIADMAASGIFGPVDPKGPLFKNVVEYEDEQKKKEKKGNVTAKGGRINRKRKGLTF